MEFEVLKRSHIKRNIMIGVVAVLIISALVLRFTHAKYRVTKSVPLANGVVNYTLPDIRIVGLYINGVEAEELDSNTNYTLDTSKSICTYKDGSNIGNLTLNYDSNTKTFSITPYTTKGTKCTLYFDEQLCPEGANACNTILANKTIDTRSFPMSNSTLVEGNTTNTIYYADTSNGRTYYFAGNPTDNWVYFAGFYWRIIRINEDGTLRLIYQGESAYATGTGTQIGTGTFSINNITFDDNAYVGYMYTLNEVHGTSTDSGIKKVLDHWYKNNIVDKNNSSGTSYDEYVSTEAGFCGDRTPSTDENSINNSGGTGGTTTYYGGYIRLTNSNMNPTFECSNDSDLYTVKGSSKGNKALDYPIGLISADEVVYAGLAWGDTTTSNYLYTGQYYWTLSPCFFDGSYAAMLYVTPDSFLYVNGVDWADPGVRPVINLKADVELTGTGTSTDPFVVV